MMQSVSDNIMLGQLCPLGTGSFTLLLDENRLADAVDVAAGFSFNDDLDRSSATPGIGIFIKHMPQHDVSKLCSVFKVLSALTPNDVPRPHTWHDTRTILSVTDVFAGGAVSVQQCSHILACWRCDFLAKWSLQPHIASL